MRTLSVRLFLAASAIVFPACGASPITQARLERSIAPTFANLVHAQVTTMRLSPVAASDLDVTASCRKLQSAGVASQPSGSGEWTCTLFWKGPDRQPLRDAYDLFVTTDGCYTAAVAGETLGGPTLRTPDDRAVRNLLYEFEGCFDIT